MTEEVQTLIFQAQSGDRNAFGTVVQRFQGMAVGYAHSILGDFALAEDAAQEAFVQAYLDLQKLQEPQAFPSWFRRIIYKYCDRQFRGKRLWTVPLEKAVTVASQEIGPMKQAECREISVRVMEAVRALPEHERTVTTLFYINGYTQAEVGEFLDVPVSTVKSRLYLARKKLQKRMTDMVEETLKQHAPGKEFARKLEETLEGIEDLEWRKGCICFCGAVIAGMKYLQEDVSYDFVAAVSGGAFHYQWHPNWAPDNCAPYVTLGEEFIRRPFQALGYEYRLTERFGENSSDNYEEAWRQRIIENINNGRPIIAFGVVGPPECCVIAGYAQKGDILLGRSYFYQDSKGYFRQAGWYKDCFGIIEIGSKTTVPARNDIIRDTLNWVIELARPAERNERKTGLAAYDAWAASLERDEDFPADDIEALTLRCMASTNDGFCYLWDVRWSASRFLTSIADEAGEAGEDLTIAAKLYHESSQLFERGCKMSPNSFVPEAERRRIADPALRRELARLIREAAEKERVAVEHLENAVNKLT